MPAARLTYASPDDPPVRRALIRAIERASGRKKLETLYASVPAQPEGFTFWDDALDRLDVSLDYDADQLQKIPKHGPVVIVANHPFGVLDGIAICTLVAKVRPNFKILINHVLCRDERLDDHFLPIDFRETRDAIRTNIHTKNKALDTLNEDGAVVIFPAGGVATSEKPFGSATDLEWKRFAAKLIQIAEATVVPFYFHGQNSRLFQLVSQVSMTLRLSLLMREVINKMGDTIHISIGDPLPYDTLAPIKDRQQLTAYLREVTFGLANASS